MPKTAIVTGAARGIGRAIAERLLSDGFTVAVVDINETEAKSAGDQLARSTGGEAFAVYVDVTDSATIQQMVDAVLARCGQIDVLVNNAGIIGPEGPIATCPEDGWAHVIAVNLTGTFLCAKAVLPTMLAHG